MKQSYCLSSIFLNIFTEEEFKEVNKKRKVDVTIEGKIIKIIKFVDETVSDICRK